MQQSNTENPKATRPPGDTAHQGAGNAPTWLGVDDADRETLSWIPGVVAATGQEIDLRELAAMVRTLHDLTTGFVEGYECVIHDDLQPRNVVVRDEKPVGIIDWEQVRAGERVEDLANLCWSFAEPDLDSSPEDVGRRWRLVIDAYGLEARDDVVAVVLSRMAKCVEDIEREAARGSERNG